MKMDVMNRQSHWYVAELLTFLKKEHQHKCSLLENVVYAYKHWNMQKSTTMYKSTLIQIDVKVCWLWANTFLSPVRWTHSDSQTVVPVTPLVLSKKMTAENIQHLIQNPKIGLHKQIFEQYFPDLTNWSYWWNSMVILLIVFVTLLYIDDNRL